MTPYKDKKTHGGKRDGAGLKPSGYIHRNVKLSFLSEEEYQLFLKLTTPRSRVEKVLYAKD